MVDKFSECIKDKKIAIVGLGGLGGYLASFIARLNPRAMLLIDGDCFALNNMNRQLFCSNRNIGDYKAECARQVIFYYTTAEITVVNEYLTEDNAQILDGCDVIMDATDNINTRKLLQKLSDRFNIPVVHGAINGLFGQVAIIRPHKPHILDNLNSTGQTPHPGATLSFVPANIATYQVSEMLKLLANFNPLESDQLLIIDLLNNDTRTIRL